jgi:hypothetical protein
MDGTVISAKKGRPGHDASLALDQHLLAGGLASAVFQGTNAANLLLVRIMLLTRFFDEVAE